MEKYLNRCLDSLIIDKGMELLEVLVINDGSKDKSFSIAKAYEQKYPEVFRVIDKENGNYGSCINRGLKEATGKYIKILDADDYYDIKTFGQFIEILKETDADIILNEYKVIDENEKELYHLSFTLPSKVCFNIKDSLKGQDFSKIRMHSVTYKRHILEAMNYIQTEKISYTDQEWIFLPITKVKTALYFNEVLYYYLYGRQGQSMSKDNITKSVTQLEQVVYLLIDKYNSCVTACDSFVKKYMERKISDQLSSIYKIYILNLKLKKEKLIEFDLNIKEKSSNIYEIPEGFIINRYFRYMKYMRKHNYNRTLANINFIISKHINSFRRIFHQQDIY